MSENDLLPVNDDRMYGCAELLGNDTLYDTSQQIKIRIIVV